MKQLFNKYCDFIGVENEGYKRLLIVSSFITPFIYGSVVEGGFIEDFFKVEINGAIRAYFIILFPISLLLNGFFIKIFNWVKDGFKK